MLDGWNEILIFKKIERHAAQAPALRERFIIFESLWSIEYDKCFEMRKNA